MVPNGTTRALRCSIASSISYTTTTNYESLCSSHAHPLGAGAANMSLRSWPPLRMDLRLCPLPVPAADASRAQMPATQISRQNACRQLATCSRSSACDGMKSVRGFKLGGNEVVDAHIASTGSSESCTGADRVIGIRLRVTSWSGVSWPRAISRTKFFRVSVAIMNTIWARFGSKRTRISRYGSAKKHDLGKRDLGENKHEMALGQGGRLTVGPE